MNVCVPCGVQREQAHYYYFTNKLICCAKKTILLLFNPTYHPPHNSPGKKKAFCHVEKPVTGNIGHVRKLCWATARKANHVLLDFLAISERFRTNGLGHKKRFGQSVCVSGNVKKQENFPVVGRSSSAGNRAALINSQRVATQFHWQIVGITRRPSTKVGMPEPLGVFGCSTILLFGALPYCLMIATSFLPPSCLWTWVKCPLRDYGHLI